MKVYLKFVSVIFASYLVGCQNTNIDNSESRTSNDHIQIVSGIYSPDSADSCENIPMGIRFFEGKTSLVLSGETSTIRLNKIDDEKRDKSVTYSGDFVASEPHPNIQDFEIEFTVKPINDSDISVSNLNTLVQLKNGDERTLSIQGPETWKRCMQS